MMMPRIDSSSAMLIQQYGQDDSDEDLDTSTEKDTSTAEKDAQVTPAEKSPEKKQGDSGESPVRRISSGLISDEEIDHFHAAERYRKRQHEVENDEASSSVPEKVMVLDDGKNTGLQNNDDTEGTLAIAGLPKSLKSKRKSCGSGIISDALKDLMNYGHDLDDEDEEDESEEENNENSHDNNEGNELEDTGPSAVMTSDLDDIQLPPEPPGKCPKALQEGITKLYQRTQMGYDFNKEFQNKRSFRNPSIYEKLIQNYDVDEKGSNFSLDVYNPHMWTKESYYDELDKRQKKDMEERREKERKTKIEYISATRKAAPSSEHSSSGASGNLWSADEKKRKSKWDALPAGLPSQGHRSGSSGSSNPGIANLTSVATGSRATVISAVGTLSKKPTFSYINSSGSSK